MRAWALALGLGSVLAGNQPMSPARCVLETSALSKAEGVRRLCTALATCAQADAQDSQGRDALEKAALAQTTRLQQQVALLSKEKVQLLQTARHDALVSAENRKLVTSIDALEHQVADGRARAAKASDAVHLATAAEAGAERAALAARHSAGEVVVLRKQLSAEEAEGATADAQRAHLEKEVLREAGVAARAAKEIRTLEAAGAKETATAASVESADSALVKRLAAAQAELEHLRAERSAVQATVVQAQRQSAAELAALRAEVQQLHAERDLYRDRANAEAANCTRKVSLLKATQQKELARFERLLER